MKLSKVTSTRIVTSSVVLFSLGLNTYSASAQNIDLVTPQVSQQIMTALGSSDGDELIVDALTQVETQLKELGVSNLTSESDDSQEVSQLKQRRQEYIVKLRQRMKNLEGQERQEYLSKIRARRVRVRAELFQMRRQAKEEQQRLQQQRVQQNQEDLQSRKELFKESLQLRQDQIKKQQLPPEEKFKDRIEEKVEKQQKQEAKSDAVKSVEQKQKHQQRKQVQGAVDYQPVTLLERLGYWLFK